MGLEPTTLRDLVGCSNHWATGDSMVSEGQFVGLDIDIVRETSYNWKKEVINFTFFSYKETSILCSLRGGNGGQSTNILATRVQ